MCNNASISPDTTSKSTVDTKPTPKADADISAIDELFPTMPLSNEPAHVVFKDSGLETMENLKQYYTVQKLPGRQPCGRKNKLFKCKLCDKTALQFCNMKSHLRKHLNLKPYCCSICGKGFTTASNCKFHLKAKPCLKMIFNLDS